MIESASPPHRTYDIYLVISISFRKTVKTHSTKTELTFISKMGHQKLASKKLFPTDLIRKKANNTYMVIQNN